MGCDFCGARGSLPCSTDGFRDAFVNTRKQYLGWPAAIEVYDFPNGPDDLLTAKRVVSIGIRFCPMCGRELT